MIVELTGDNMDFGEITLSLSDDGLQGDDDISIVVEAIIEGKVIKINALFDLDELIRGLIAFVPTPKE